MFPINSNDRELIEEARSIIAKRFKEDYHHVEAALRTKSGKTFSAVHLEAYVGRIAVCAEAIAIGMAAAAGDTEIETIVAVNLEGQIVSPCGMCRELISDYAPSCKVIITEEEAIAINDLLPRKYQRSS
ncbi:cytidine deaminase [Candidatus Gracilibacteria bacterium]|nr:cytidine deaminase [Candidatus Gracilibacteria bacterium]NJP22067.1 cytidine deaminase [Hydrococcus sp. CRU_1_1]NJQ98424.1 cytidine deaminase [Hydrococcus sp. CSU_1_8]